MIQTRTATHKNWSRWGGGVAASGTASDDEGIDGGISLPRKCDKTGEDRRIRSDSVSTSCRESLSKSCHSVGGLSRIKNALSRSVHSTTAAPSLSSSSCHKTRATPTDITFVDHTSYNQASPCVTPKDLVNFAEHQSFALPTKHVESVDRRARACRNLSFRRRKQFDELDDDTDESSDEFHAPTNATIATQRRCASSTPSNNGKSSSLRVMPQNPRPPTTRNCTSMTDVTSGRGPAHGKLPPAVPRCNNSKSRSVVVADSSSRDVDMPLPVHLAAEKMANQKIALDRSLRRSASPTNHNTPGRPPRGTDVAAAVVPEKKRRPSANGSCSNFAINNQASFTQLEKAFGKEDTLDHYFEMVKASPGKSPSRGPRSVFTYSPGTKAKATLMANGSNGDCRSVFSPTRSPSKSMHSRSSPRAILVLPKLSPTTPTTSKSIPMQQRHSSSPSLQSTPSASSNAMASNSVIAAASPANSVCAAQLEIPTSLSSNTGRMNPSTTTTSEPPLAQLQVQFNLYEKMKHSALDLMADCESFVSYNNDSCFNTMETAGAATDTDDCWDLGQILASKAK